MRLYNRRKDMFICRNSWERRRDAECCIFFAPAGRLGVRQLAAAFENSSIFEHFTKSASKLAHSESFAYKKYAVLGETPALPGVVFAEHRKSGNAF
jgi:hypothetical protein